MMEFIKKFFRCSLMLLTLFLSYRGDAQSSVAEGKQVVQKWIEARKLISQEKADWIEDKAILEESVRVFTQQSGEITKEIDAAVEATSRTQNEYDDLKKENEDIITATETILAKVKGFEARLNKEIKSLPLYLQERLKPLTVKLPENSEESTLPVTARMQLVVAIIGEIEKFQNAITVASELRKVASGEELEVRTIYIGLAQAFYADQDGIYAGRGIPGADGWQWEDQTGLGDTINLVIDQYEEKATASFTELPVIIKNK